MLRTFRKLLGTSGTEDKALRKTQKAMKTATKNPTGESKQEVSGDTQTPRNAVKPYEEQKRVEERKKGRIHKNTEQEYTEEFDGCSACSGGSLSIQWIDVSQSRKVKSIECKSCNAIYEEKIVDGETGKKLVLKEVDSIDNISSVGSAVSYEVKKHLKLLIG